MGTPPKRRTSISITRPASMTVLNKMRLMAISARNTGTRISGRLNMPLPRYRLALRI